MDAFDELRKVLEQHALQASTQLGFKIIFDEDEAPKSGTYVHFWYETGKTESMGAAGGRKGFECTPGILQFNIYYPEKTPTGQPTRIADGIKRLLNMKQWTVAEDGYVKCEPMTIQRQPLSKNGFRIIWTRAPFDFYHRDQTASDSYSG